MRKRDKTVILICVGYLLWLGFTQLKFNEKPAVNQEKVVDVQKIEYETDYSEMLTLQKKAEEYENFYIAYLLLVEPDLGNESPKGKFNGAESFNAQYPTGLGDNTNVRIEYSYNNRDELLLQSIYVTPTGMHHEHSVYVTYDKDGEVVDAYEVFTGGIL